MGLHPRRTPLMSTMAILLTCMAVAAASTHGHAAEIADQAVSLKAIPADASFYVAMLKNRRQVELLRQTNAWKKFINIPIVNMGMNQALTYWQFPPDERLAAVRDWVQGPEGRATVGLATEMVSDELIIYGDQRLAAVLELLMEFNSEINAAQAEVMRNINNPESDSTEEDIVVSRMQAFLEAHGDELVVPTLVVAGQIKDQEQSAQVLDIIEEQLRQLAPMSPVPLEGKLNREQSDDVDLVTLTLTGDMLPWDRIESEYEDNPALYHLLREIVYEKTMVLTVGRVGEFFVLSVSESSDHVTKPRTGKLLIDTPEFERLQTHAGEQLTSIAYVSGTMMKTISSNERTFRDMAVTLKGALALSDLDDLRKAAIESDIDELVAELIAYVPDASTVAGVSFMTDRGYESYTYNWGTLPPAVNATNKLSLINHVGVDSIGWTIASGKQSVESYDHLTAWLERIFTHVEAIAEHQAPVDDWKEYEQLRSEILPLLERLDTANRTQLLPVTASGQGAVVFDASATSDSWCEFMPEARRELPLPAFAVVYAIDDPGKLKAGIGEYFAVMQQALEVAHRINPEIAEVILPHPEVTSVSGGVLYSYAFPEAWGANERLAPCAALGEDVLVLSVLPEVSEKLLAKSAPELDGPLANFDRPMITASHFKIARFIDTMTPWTDYGVQVAMQKQEQGEAHQAIAMVGFVKPQIEQVLDVLKAFDSVTSVQFLDRDVVVVHSETRIIDRE